MTVVDTPPVGSDRHRAALAEVAGDRAAAAAPAAPLDALVIGAGFSGLAIAHHLDRQGARFLALEQGPSVGGTWRENCYPGCACDVESHLYSFSFAPSPNWTRRFAERGEIEAYLRDFAERRGLLRHMRFGVRVAQARFDEQDAVWRVRDEGGAEYVARFLVSAIGGLSRPTIPSFPGAATFAGEAFHSAHWPQSFEPAGKRIALIGTGASAIQIAPEMAKVAAQLDLYQRTPAWVVAKPDKTYDACTRTLFRWAPGARALHRLMIYWRRELVLLFLQNAKLSALSEAAALQSLEAVHDPELRKRLTPQYRIGCKRVLQSNDFYPIFNQPNVSLVSEAIAEIEPSGIRDRAGVLRAYDAIIYATGFNVADAMGGLSIVNASGCDLRDASPMGREGYLGIMARNFPNFFTLLGPNSGLGHNSIVLMIEAQARVVANMIKRARAKNLKRIEVTPEAQARYNERLHTKLSRSVWSSGCQSWYLDPKTGRNYTLWPSFTFEYILRMRRAPWSDVRTGA